MFIELDADGSVQMALEEIPHQFSVTTSTDKTTSYVLVGVVNFIPPYTGVMEKTAVVGHYTAICRRSKDSWTEYNDLMEKEQQKGGLSLCCLHLLVYIKN